MSGTLLVGYDGSAPSRGALAWAAREAHRRGARLTVLALADHSALAGSPSAQLARRWGALRTRANALADEACRLTRSVSAALDVEVTAQVGSPVAALVAASHRGDALVLGAVRRVGPASRHRALIVESVAAQAHSPVLVVRGADGAHGTQQGPVVVGVDGSSRSLRALEVATRSAAATRSPLHVVCVWSPTTSTSRQHGSRNSRQSPEVVLDESTAGQVVGDAVARAARAHPELAITAVVRAGYPPAVLLGIARGAGLLVVGRRGNGERSLVFGSVCRAALRALPCPVAVVGLHTPPQEEFAQPAERSSPAPAS
jgi:nucleotide-binding universal stress UspA family protein